MIVLSGTSPRWHMWVLVVVAVAFRSFTGMSLVDGAEMWGRFGDVIATGEIGSIGLIAIDIVFLVVLVIVSMRRLNDLQRSPKWVCVLLLSIPLDVAQEFLPASADVLGVLLSVLHMVPTLLLLLLLFQGGRREVRHADTVAASS